MKQGQKIICVQFFAESFSPLPLLWFVQKIGAIMLSTLHLEIDQIHFQISQSWISKFSLDIGAVFTEIGWTAFTSFFQYFGCLWRRQNLSKMSVELFSETFVGFCLKYCRFIWRLHSKCVPFNYWCVHLFEIASVYLKVSGFFISSDFLICLSLYIIHPGHLYQLVVYIKENGR